MQVAKSLHEFQTLRKLLGNNGKVVSFVPTMGNLHSGHLQLMKIAKQNSDVVVSSVFVNPAQFAANEDFDKYPRTLQSDLEKMKEIGVDLVLAPGGTSELYPHGYMTRVFMSKISTDTAQSHPLRNSSGSVGEELNHNWLEDQPEAICRSGFFDGVSTILVKLFNIVRPQVIVFGQKDAVQCMVVKRLVKDLNYIDIEKVIIGETERELDGLAMSSRNQYLSPIDRKYIAPILNRILFDAQSSFKNIENVNAESLRKWLQDSYNQLEFSFEEKLKNHYSNGYNKEDYKIDYLSVCNWNNGHVYGTISTNNIYTEPFYSIEKENLQDLTQLCLSTTVRVGGTRLLDNLIINVRENGI
ncbi:pantoate-beta-alanine ligase [Naegleria gruberi]|uniref:Pantoate--beta-alanine ligase n=1 Tax=Naegleria gruberi TaxID=5762 RepID=D2W045_NAEGR|nr:pantoate-beta-alanine ligase [Naegleria gruberi]EFC37511.1 pantoate-beta-alanine ligase [Naegleria gruberi]|eukprot:XP_002670255.1 pantoate-beta-alanine ligase [Naegleria gruberi strain NEG-M]